jgi:hypothetical protein
LNGKIRITELCLSLLILPKETAIRMLNADFSIKEIVKFTGLTEKEVKELMS